MRHYNNILYVSHGVSNEKEGLKQAVSLARNNDAALKILTLIPKLPEDIVGYKESFEHSISERVQKTLSDVISELKVGTIESSIELMTADIPAIDIIKYVLTHGYDIVVKEASLRNDTSGFEAIDMALLRKCPVPLWLSRPISKTRTEVKVAVAVDPESPEDSSEFLAFRMLHFSSSLAEKCNKTLDVISCWDYELENALRNSIFVKMPAEKVDEKVEERRQTHLTSFQNLVKKAEITCHYELQHLRGNPTDTIPDFVKQNNIDILFMGTVARTAIAGFMIGNTAENIIQQLPCSLVALKPHGFVSPVTL
ncbi:MAG: universal stress protein [Pseudomonadota bacterium]